MTAVVTQPAHPGTVTFIGPDGTPRVEQAQHVPDWLKFAAGPDGVPVPVVRVVRQVTDRGSSLRSFAADGRLVWVGMTVPLAPIAARRPALAKEPTGWF